MDSDEEEAPFFASMETAAASTPMTGVEGAEDLPFSTEEVEATIKVRFVVICASIVLWVMNKVCQCLMD